MAVPINSPRPFGSSKSPERSSASPQVSTSSGAMGNRFVATSIEGFIQQVAVSYLRNGYWFFVAGSIPADKPPEAIDAKLTRQYQAGVSKHVRYRRKRRGENSVHYIRCGRFFLLMSTAGKGSFFIFERGQIRDARREPIRAFGYSVGVRRGRVSVRIDASEFAALRLQFLALALADRAVVERRFWDIGFVPYRPVRRQVLSLWRAVNRKRKEASLPQLDKLCVRWRRDIVLPFGEREK